MESQFLIRAALAGTLVLSGCTGAQRTHGASVVPKGVFEADLDTVAVDTVQQQMLLHRDVKAMELAFDGNRRGAAILWLRGQSPRVTRVQVTAAKSAAGFDVVLTGGQRFHLLNQGQVLICTNCDRYHSPTRWIRKNVRLP